MSDKEFLKSLNCYGLDKEQVLKIVEMSKLVENLYEYKKYVPSELNVRLDFLYVPSETNKNYDSKISFTIMNERAYFERVLFSVFLHYEKPYPLYIRYLDNRKKINEHSKLISHCDNLFKVKFRDEIIEMAKK